MTDCIGKELHVDDYVTAVWANGDLAIFKVVGFRERGSRAKNGRRRTQDEIILERFEKNPEIDADVKNKPVYKQPSQVTWVDQGQVMLYLLGK